MVIKKTLIAFSILAVSASVAIAQDPISQRQSAMKSVGGATKVLSDTMKGQRDFDANAVIAAFQTMNDVAKDYASYFPEGSETGGDTTASPKIWEDRAGFEAALAKFEADTAAAIAAAPSDVDALKPLFGQVAANCGACHKVYRISKN